jgi:hypothetical protein
VNVLELATEAGLAVGYGNHLATTAELERFADLVLEEAAKACDEVDDAWAGEAAALECAERIRALKVGK